MGYYTSMSEEIEIDPPLRREEVDPVDFEFYGAKSGPLALHDEDPDVVYAIRPYDSDSVKAYYIEENLQYFVDKYGKGRAFSGHIYGEGENNDDMWRLVVRDGKATKIKPVITWPEN